jgi:Tfp pilus assembly protein PilF
MADFNSAIAVQPQYAAAYRTRAVAYYRTGRIHDAMADFSNAIVIQPEYTECYKGRAMMYTELAGQTSNAKQKAEYERLAEEDYKMMEKLGGTR